ncbi:hypothetical protein QNI19_18625 [Cytophagaceae bacterium DM2B3-1]|uniref:Uncharacterized protein n=1 Tax=Xanthocytophaga flava TaxID=3048013 RepID=A0ABT7CPP6_9BACT|nr:hypothetical protein [Xanthocytophaga flavus]MDJ1494960.1 hypothetical protein [Xanthocytophaga flavus]
MFSITHNGQAASPNYEYDGRLIHFGGNFKSIEYEWEEWKVKFENLLSRLYWLEADVHIKPEYTHVQTFTWGVDLYKWNELDRKLLKPIQKEYFVYNE